MFKKLALTLGVAAVFAVAVGCGASPEQNIDKAQEQINALESKGVPPGELSMAKVHLAQARENLRLRNNSKARENITAMQTVIAAAEKFYEEQVATLPPKIAELRQQAIAAKEADLTGYQARKVDSTVAAIDSFLRIDRPLQAHDAAKALVELLPSLREDEAIARRLTREIVGTWTFLDTVKSVEFPARDAARERKDFTFGRDGSVVLVEQKRGQSTPMFKEDWLFRSWGTFGLKGDTVMLSIDRFKAERQNFEKLNPTTNRWELERQPTYDSLITDGSQDRFINMQDLCDDFRVGGRVPSVCRNIRGGR